MSLLLYGFLYLLGGFITLVFLFSMDRNTKVDLTDPEEMKGLSLIIAFWPIAAFAAIAHYGSKSLIHGAKAIADWYTK